jgi:hypothetical protein
MLEVDKTPEKYNYRARLMSNAGVIFSLLYLLNVVFVFMASSVLCLIRCRGYRRFLLLSWDYNCFGSSS